MTDGPGISDDALFHLRPFIRRNASPVGLRVDERYEIIERIGQGGMGEVYRAHDERLNRDVAMKVLSDAVGSSEWADRFRKEAETLTQIEHAGIVPIHDLGTLPGGRLYYTMKYVTGHTLSALIEQGAPRSRLLSCLRSACAIVHVAHERGIIHRDVKPSNMMVDDRGQVYVVDWGLARLREAAEALDDSDSSCDERVTRWGKVLGTVAYMSPEQARGEHDQIDAQSDVFSLGASLFEILVGKPPPQDLVVPSPHTIDSGLPSDLDAICRKALEKQKNHRYATAAELGEDLDRYREGEPTLARPLPALSRLGKKMWKQRWVVIPSLVALLAVVFLGGWLGKLAIDRAAKVRGFLTKAKDREGKGDMEGARDGYRSALEIDADNLQARAGLERVESELRRRKDAEREALKLFEAGRPALDQAYRYRYRVHADYSDLQRRVDIGKKQIERGIRKAPHLAMGHYLLGRAWKLQGRRNLAVACFEKAVELDPEFGPGHYVLGRIYLKKAFMAVLLATPFGMDRMRRWSPGGVSKAQGFAKRGRRALELAISAESGFVTELHMDIAVAMLAYTKEDWNAVRSLTNRALRRWQGQEGVEELHWLRGLSLRGKQGLREFQAAVARAPNFGLGLFCLANSLVEDHRPGESVPHYQRVLRIQPRFYPAHLNLGNAYLNLREYKKALEEYDRVLEAKPDLSWGHVYRGAALRKLGREGEAAKCFHRALQLDARNRVAFYHLAIQHAQKREYRVALEYAESAMRLGPKRSDSLSLRGRIHAMMGNQKEAIRDYTSAIGRNGRNAEAYSYRCLARYLLGDLAGAERDGSEAIKINPFLPQAYRHRGMLRFYSGRQKEGLADMNRSVELDPRHAESRALRGTAYFVLERNEEALLDFIRAIELKPRNISAYIGRARVYERIGDEDAAWRDFDRAMKLRPDYGLAWLYRGMMREREGDMKGAIQDLEKALRLTPATLRISAYMRKVLSDLRQLRSKKP